MGSLSTGAAVGVAVGCLLVVGIVAVIIYHVLSRSKSRARMAKIEVIHRVGESPSAKVTMGSRAPSLRPPISRSSSPGNRSGISSPQTASTVSVGTSWPLPPQDDFSPPISSAQAGWVSPLDIHFVRPTTPVRSRPHTPDTPDGGKIAAVSPVSNLDIQTPHAVAYPDWLRHRQPQIISPLAPRRPETSILKKSKLEPLREVESPSPTPRIPPKPRRPQRPARSLSPAIMELIDLVRPPSSAYSMDITHAPQPLNIQKERPDSAQSSHSRLRESVRISNYSWNRSSSARGHRETDDELPLFHTDVPPPLSAGTSLSSRACSPNKHSTLSREFNPALLIAQDPIFFQRDEERRPSAGSLTDLYDSYYGEPMAGKRVALDLEMGI